jgi:uncharacterized protein (TIGR04255 family)
MIDKGKKKYKVNYLSEVIFQIRFAEQKDINVETIKEYKRSLGASYSDLSDVVQQGIIIHNDGSEFSTENEDVHTWQIESKDKVHTVIIEKNSLAVVFKQYVNFKKYSELVGNTLDNFKKAFPNIKYVDRLGLRYVNKIRPKDKTKKWDELLNKELVGSLKFVKVEKVRRSMSSIVISHDDETMVTINSGLFNQYYPSPIIDHEFILDIDAFSPSPVKIDDVMELTSKFNTTIAVYFECSITDDLRLMMEVINE